MLFDVGLPEILVILVGALFIFGPDRLPKAAAQAARTLRELRGMAAGARSDLGDALGPELSDLTMNLRDLDPRTAISRALLDDASAPVERVKPQVSGPRVQGPTSAASTTGQTSPPAGQTPRFDADAT